jgi:hypothetical protein
MPIEYRFEARFTDAVEIGPVAGGVRVDNHFDGRMTAGELAGARVRGVDQTHIRPDGSVALDIRETIEASDGAIAADVRGYALPQPGADDRFDVRGYALFSTAVPQYAHYNTAVVAIDGVADLAAGTLAIEGRAAA